MKGYLAADSQKQIFLITIIIVIIEVVIIINKITEDVS